MALRRQSHFGQRASAIDHEANPQETNIMSHNTWKLQDAKARFSEVVRRAQAGEPQHVTLRGKEAVVMFDPQRFVLTPKQETSEEWTMAGFIERSRRYQLDADVEFDRPLYMTFPSQPLLKRRRRRS